MRVKSLMWWVGVYKDGWKLRVDDRHQSNSIKHQASSLLPSYLKPHQHHQTTSYPLQNNSNTQHEQHRLPPPRPVPLRRHIQRIHTHDIWSRHTNGVDTPISRVSARRTPLHLRRGEDTQDAQRLHQEDVEGNQAPCCGAPPQCERRLPRAVWSWCLPEWKCCLDGGYKDLVTANTANSGRWEE